MKNKKLVVWMLISFIVIILFPFYIPNKSYAIVMDATFISTRNFNIHGQGVITTFGDYGYYTHLMVDGEEQEIKNGSGSLNQVTCTTNLSYISNGNYVKISYTVRNNSSTTKTIGVSTHTDIQIASQDYAPITNLSGNRGFTMSDGANYTFTFIGRNSYGVTDVDAYWFGNYQYHDSMKWENSQTYYYGSGERRGDSGMAFCWKNRTIRPGESQTYSALIGVGSLNVPPTIRVTSRMKSQYYQNESVPVDGYVNDVDRGDIVTVKYAVDGGRENVISNNIVPNGVEKAFSASFKIPYDISGGQHFFQVWAADNQGNISQAVTVYFNVTKDVTAPTATHTLTPDDWTNKEVRITVTASDDITGVKRIKLPNGSYLSSSTVNYTVNQNSSYTFVLEDYAGNTREYVVSVSNIDKIQPTSNITQNPDEWSIDNITINWSFSDEQSGMKQVKLPNGQVTTDTSGEYVVSKNGDYIFYAYDNVGNETKVVKTITQIDNIKPEGVLHLSNSELTDQKISILWEAFDNESGFSKIILPDATISNNAEGGYEISKIGTYTFIIYDNVGNDRIISIEVNNIDMIKPNLTVTQKVTRWTNEDIILYWEASDYESGLKQVVLPNSDRVEEPMGEHKVTQNGIYTFIAYDKIGNGTMVKHEVTNIDKQAPNLLLLPNYLEDGRIEIKWVMIDTQSGTREIVLPNGERTSDVSGSYFVDKSGEYSFIAYDNVGNGRVEKTTII